MRLLSNVLPLLCLLAAASSSAALPPAPADTAALPPASADAAAPLESVVTMRLDGSITVDERGQVSEFHLDTPVVPVISTALGRIVPQWQFKPVLVDGKPHSARAKVRMILAAQKVGETYQARIDNAVFRDSFDASANANESPALITAKRMPPPAYPFGALQAGISGRVLLAVKVRADGRADKVMPVQTLLFDVKGRELVLRAAIKQFEQAAVNATRSWRFNVAPRNTPRTDADMTVMVPVQYIVGSAQLDAPGTWHTVIRGPKRKAQWLGEAPGLQRIGASDASGTELIPATSVVQLATEVAGAPVM